MKKYYYRNGQEVKAGDFCFYSEDNGKSDYHYANSIMEIVEADGRLCSKLIYGTIDDGISLARIKDDLALDLKYSCGYVEKSNVLQHYIKLNEFKDDVTWVNENFGRKNKKKKIDAFIRIFLLNIQYENRINN